MTAYHIKNGSGVAKAFRADGYLEIVEAGAEGEVNTASPLTEAQIDAYAADGVKVTEGKGKKGKGKGDVNPPPPPPAGPEAIKRDDGTFSVKHGEDELIAGLTQEQADTFNGLDEAARAEFIAAWKKPE